MYTAVLRVVGLTGHQQHESRNTRHVRAAQVAPCYPKRVGGFVEEVTGLLQTHAAVLDPALRQTLVKALILMRNRGQASQP